MKLKRLCLQCRVDLEFSLGLENMPDITYTEARQGITRNGAKEYDFILDAISPDSIGSKTDDRSGCRIRADRVKTDNHVTTILDIKRKNVKLGQTSN